MAVLQTFGADVSSEAVAASVADHGYAIVRDLLDDVKLATLSEQLAPHLDAVDLGDPDPFFGHKTKRFGALLSRCPITREMLTHQLILGTADLVLGPHCVRYQLNYTGVMHLAPGETAQSMHRDTGFYPIQNPAPPLTLATMWAVTDFTPENGVYSKRQQMPLSYWSKKTQFQNRLIKFYLKWHHSLYLLVLF